MSRPLRRTADEGLKAAEATSTHKYKLMPYRNLSNRTNLGSHLNYLNFNISPTPSIVVVKKTFRYSNVFFYNRTPAYAALPNFGTLLWKTV